MHPRPRRTALVLILLILVFPGCLSRVHDGSAPSAATSAMPTAVATADDARSATPRSSPAASPAVSPTVTATPTTAPATPSATALAGPGALGQRALETVRHLAGDIGPRPAGSDQERRAAEWLQQQLAAIGYETEMQEFPVVRFVDDGATLEVQAPASRQIPAINLLYGGSGDVSAGLVYAGLGRPGEFPAETSGRIALVDRGEITFQEKADNALSAGAVAVIIVNNVPGNLRGALREPAGIPVVSVAQDEGPALRELAARGDAVLHLTSRTQVTESTSQNVVGRIARPGAPIIIVGGHYDSIPEGPGANDNASGTAVALEVARALAGETAAEIRYLAFGAEEIGLVGSRAYVDSLSEEERGRITLMVNLDMVGVGTQLEIGGEREITQRALALAGEHGVGSVELSGDLSGRSDHASFASAGIRTLFFHWGEDPNYHTPEDRVEAISPDLLEQTGQIALETVRQVLAGEAATASGLVATVP